MQRAGLHGGREREQHDDSSLSMQSSTDRKPECRRHRSRHSERLGDVPQLRFQRLDSAKSEDTLANQQPTQSAGSNSTEALNGGWPAYEFGDNAFSGIVRELKRRLLADGDVAEYSQYSEPVHG